MQQEDIYIYIDTRTYVVACILLFFGRMLCTGLPILRNILVVKVQCLSEMLDVLCDFNFGHPFHVLPTSSNGPQYRVRLSPPFFCISEEISLLGSIAKKHCSRGRFMPNHHSILSSVWEHGPKP